MAATTVRESAIRDGDGATRRARALSTAFRSASIRSAARRSRRPTTSGATDYLRGELREGMEAWNVGANVGVYTLQLAHWVGATGRVVAFEPNPEARAVLARNVALQLAAAARRDRRVGGRVKRRGSVDFFTSGADGMGRAGRANPLLAETSRIQVPVTALDPSRRRADGSRTWSSWTSKAGRSRRCEAPARCSLDALHRRAAPGRLEVVGTHPRRSRGDPRRGAARRGAGQRPIAIRSAITGRWCSQPRPVRH